MTAPILLTETVRWDCPAKCGYYRVSNVAPERRTRIIHHLAYGDITEADLAERDIDSHECNEYHNAVIRLNRRRALRYRKELGLRA